MEIETVYPINKEFTENIGKQIPWKFKPVYHFVYKNIERGRDYSMSKFESKLYEDTIGEIARLEEELNFLRQFIKLVGSSPKKLTKSISKPSTKSSARYKSTPLNEQSAKSARKTLPKLTKSGKKVGRPTNAEKEAKKIKQEKEDLDKIGIII